MDVDVLAHSKRPRLNPAGELVGVIGRREVDRHLDLEDDTDAPISDLMVTPALAYGDETLRTAADRMAVAGVGVLPVVDRANPARLIGLLSQRDLPRARERLLIEERHREQIIHLRRLPRLNRGPNDPEPETPSP